MRHRSDKNQTEIINQLRKRGITVAVLSQAGDGFPDIVAGYKGVNYLLEIKDGSKPPSKQKLTPAQVEFHDKWRGQIAVINSIEQALKTILNK